MARKMESIQARYTWTEGKGWALTSLECGCVDDTDPDVRYASKPTPARALTAAEDTALAALKTEASSLHKIA